MEQGNDPMHASPPQHNEHTPLEELRIAFEAESTFPSMNSKSSAPGHQPIVALEFIAQAMIAFSRREKTMAETIVTRPGNMKL
jgi:hypothetical protein